MSDGFLHVFRRLTGVAATVVFLTTAEGAMTSKAKHRIDGRVRSADGVEIAYTVCGAGKIALVFVHGGLADRTFWAPQLEGLAEEFRVVALDLGGHGESGTTRKAYTIASWANDVRAVVDALQLKSVVLIGNSLGGPVALEAACLLPGRVLGVVGVDTLHDLTQKMDVATAHARAEAFRKDFAGACHQLVDALFHPGTQAELRAWAAHRMCAMPPEVVVSIMESFGGYDVVPAAKAAGVPVRAINGDLWPTSVDVNRTVVADFDARIMKGAGHYPMLERPAEFNRILAEVVRALQRPVAGRGRG